MAKKQTFSTYTPEELDRFVAQSRDELRGLLFSVAGSKNQNVKKAIQLRHQIARALTERNRRA